MLQSLRTEDAFDSFARRLSDEGLRSALAGLLALTDYRFIGIFRFKNGQAAAAVHYDRENPNELRSAEVPETATYCCYVRDSRGAFTTANALLDARLDGHAAREAVPAYCGVPIMDSEGVIFGTLCCYDVVPRDPAQVDMPLLLQVASRLAQTGQVPPYPY